VTQTSAEGYGQIYVGPVNWLLMLVTLGLTVGFGKSLMSASQTAAKVRRFSTGALGFTAETDSPLQGGDLPPMIKRKRAGR
jgi:KUP system potassium uptake protein